MRNAFIDAVIAACAEREEIVILSGDAGLGVFDEFRIRRPDRFLNLGVAEQNMAGFAAGLAMTGHRVVLYNIIPFLLYRCYEQVRNDICYQGLPVVMAGIGSGVTYAPQGMTHYSVEDIGVARTLGNLAVLSPADPVEARAAARYCLESPLPSYVRLAKRGEPVLGPDAPFDITKPRRIRDGGDVVIAFHGSIGAEVLEATRLLEERGVSPRLLSVPLLSPFSAEAFLAETRDIRLVVSVEEQFARCGLGALLSDLWMEHRPGWMLKSLGIPPAFIHLVRDAAGMRDSFGISARGIATEILRLMAGVA